MRRAISTVLLLVLLSVGLSGCWSRRELTSVSFIGIMAIDWVDDQYQITINALTPKIGAPPGSNQLEVWTISDQGRAIDQAMAKIDRVLSRGLTLSHVRTVVFGEELARKGIGPALDFLLRSIEIRPSIWVAVSVGRAADLLEARPRQEANLASDPLGQQDFALRRTSVLPTWRLVEVASLLQEEGIDLALPLFYRGDQELPPEVPSVESNAEKAAETVFGGAAIFRNDRLISWIGPEATRGFLGIIEKVTHGTIAAPCEGDGGQAIFRLRKSSGGIRTHVVDGKIRAEIKMRVIADLNEMGCRNLTAATTPTTPDQNEIEKLLAKKIRAGMQDAVTVVRETGSDFIGLGQTVYRQNPALFRRLQSDWPRILAEMPVEIQVEAIAPRLGQTYRKYLWSTD